MKTKNQKLFEEAKKFIPGGVNSPVRSFKSVGGTPVFIKKARGSKITDENGKSYIDFCSSWGPMILGHANREVISELDKALLNGTSYGTATKKEIELAKLIISMVPSIEQVRLTTSGTEAAMSAIRLARAYTGKNKIIKFDGAYHGHADYLLVKGGSGLATLGTPDSLGVPKDFSRHTIVIPFNDEKRLKAAIKKYRKDLAAVIVEPIGGNCGVIPPNKGYLKLLRKLATQNKFILIFDEVMTGFRVAPGGAQERFSVKPDLTCLGKIIGGGLPIGAFGGKKKIMQFLAPLGGAYQAGTLSGNPVAVTAGIKTLKLLKKKKPYKSLERKTKILTQKILELAKENNIDLTINQVGSMFSLFFTKEKIFDFKTAQKQDTKRFAKFFHALLEEGVYFSPSGFEANFLSIAHTDQDLLKTARAIEKAFKRI